MFKKSVYEWINDQVIKNIGLPYDFQDPYTAGMEDVEYILWKDGLHQSEKEVLSLQLIELIIGCINNRRVIKELKKQLIEKPLIQCLESINKRIKLYIAEKAINEEGLYELGIKLATKSKTEELVKLGIIILGFFENYNSKEIIKLLGLHSEFTLYALEASKNFLNHNEFVFELATNTSGYGKLVSIYILEPVHNHQKNWIFEKGAINAVLPNMSAITCIEKTEMIKFYTELYLTKENFSKLSYLLAYAFEESNVKQFSSSVMLVGKYIGEAKTSAETFIDLAAIAMINKSMAPYWNQYGIDVEKENGWSSNKESKIRKICIEIMEQSFWLDVIYKELKEPEEKTSLIIKVVEELKLLPFFIQFLPLLRMDAFDMDILRHVLINNPDYYLTDVKNYMENLLPKEVYNTGPSVISLDEITTEYKPDIWLVYLLKAMVRQRIYEETLFIKCLTARFVDVRIEAVKALRSFKQIWSKDVFTALEAAYIIEPVKDVKKKLMRLLGKNDSTEKEKRYVDISKVRITPFTDDVCILNTKIAGLFYRELTEKAGIEYGDILYLIREPENKYDENAIIVTDNTGYVLGYVPKKHNILLAAMMDEGKKFYAILTSDDLNIKNSEISVMFYKRPNKE